MARGKRSGQERPQVIIADELAVLTARFEALLPVANVALGSAPDQPSWTCDGGAVVFAEMLRRAGIGHRLCVGLYWWPEERSEEMMRLLDRDEQDPLDEHHHWVEIDDARLDAPLLFDPNGELRHEPRLQVLTEEARNRYRPDDAQAIWSGIDSTTRAAEVATWSEEVAAALVALDAAVVRSTSPEVEEAHRRLEAARERLFARRAELAADGGTLGWEAERQDAACRVLRADWDQAYAAYKASWGSLLG